MARKNKGGSGNFFLMIIIVVLIAIAVATPIIIVIGYFYNKSKALGIKSSVYGNMSDFWLDDEEKQEFKGKTKQLIEISAIIDNAHESAEKANIARNIDGSYSARSSLGKEIKATIIKNEPILEALNEQLTMLQNVPIDNWNKLNNYIKRTRSFAISFIVWFSAIAIYFFALGKKSVADVLYIYLGLVTNFFRDRYTEIPLTENDIKMVAVATVTAIIAFFISNYIFKDCASKYTPKPEIVTLYNIDKY